MDADDIPSRDVPYDPDMTVEEALRMGLIAIVDSGRIGSPNWQPCNHPSPYPRSNTDGDAGTIACTRMRGHAGHHAFVVRWNMSYVEWQAEQMRRVRDERAREEARKRQVEARDRAEQELQKMAEAAKKMGQVISQIPAKPSPVEVQFNRDISMVYGPMAEDRNRTSKKAKYRHQDVGKIKGRR